MEITHDPTPPGALDSSRCGVELLLHVVEGAKTFVNRLLERPIVEATAFAFALLR